MKRITYDKDIMVKNGMNIRNILWKYITQINMINGMDYAIKLKNVMVKN